MTNNTSTFTPSTQILEAGEKAQALADAGKTLKPFLPQEAQQTVEGVEKIANALNSTGEALRHFGFDEDESYSSDFTSEPQVWESIDPFFSPITTLPSVIEPVGVIEPGDPEYQAISAFFEGISSPGEGKPGVITPEFEPIVINPNELEANMVIDETPGIQEVPWQEAIHTLYATPPSNINLELA